MNSSKTLPKLIAVIGPTSSGKSELAVRIAKSLANKSAVISADSRQVYCGMDIGTGKIVGHTSPTGDYLYKGVLHYGIDIASPKRQYSVAQFQKYAASIITDIAKRGSTPILCGGTAQWIDAVVYQQSIPPVKPNAILRRKLEKMSVEQLFSRLQKIDPNRASTIDSHNPRRLLRALEIVLTTGKPVPKQNMQTRYNVLWLGLKPDSETLALNIKQRLLDRLNDGMLREVQLLHEHGLSWKRLEAFGLEYKYCALHLQNKLSYDEMVLQLQYAILHYAKRQITWWKRNKDIQWSNNPTHINKLVTNFIKNKGA